MPNLIKSIRDLTQDTGLKNQNKKIKKILRTTNWKKPGENKRKRFELGNEILLELTNDILSQSGGQNSAMLKLSIQKLANGFIGYKTEKSKKQIPDEEKLGIRLRQVWDTLEPHIGETRKKFISLWAIYGIGLNSDLDIIDPRYLDMIIASNTLKIYYSIAVDDLADNNELNKSNRDVIRELLLIRNVMLPHIFNGRSFTENDLQILLKKQNIDPKRIKFASAIHDVISEFCALDRKLPFFNTIETKMLNELQMHLDACIVTYNFNNNPDYATLDEYMNIESRGMLMLSFFYSQTAGRHKKIKNETLRIKENIVDYMQRSQRIINDINTWEREYNEKCFYNSILVSALEKKHITPNDLRKQVLKDHQILIIKKDTINDLMNKTIGYLEKIKETSPEQYYEGAQERVLWVGKIQKAFEGEI